MFFHAIHSGHAIHRFHFIFIFIFIHFISFISFTHSLIHSFPSFHSFIHCHGAIRGAAPRLLNAMQSSIVTTVSILPRELCCLALFCCAFSFCLCVRRVRCVIAHLWCELLGPLPTQFRYSRKSRRQWDQNIEFTLRLRERVHFVVVLFCELRCAFGWSRERACLHIVCL